MNYRIILVFAFFLFVVSCSDKGVKYHLGYRLEPGSVYEVYSKTVNKSNQEIFGQKVNVESKQEIYGEWHVESMSKDSIYDIQIMYTRYINESNANDTIIRIDSNDDYEGIDFTDQPAMYLVGKEMLMKLSKTGQIVSFKGMNDIMDIIFDESLRANPLMKEVISQFTDEGFKNSLSQYSIFPEKPVSIGDKWKSTFDMNIFIQFTTTNEFTLLSVDGDKAKISLIGNITTAKSKGNGLMNMIGSMMNVKGTMIGTYDIDLKTGQILDAKIETTMDSSIELMGMKMPMQMTSESYINMKRKD